MKKLLKLKTFALCFILLGTVVFVGCNSNSSNGGNGGVDVGAMVAFW